MLTATTTEARDVVSLPPSSSRPGVQIVVRRRRVIGVLSGCALGSALLGSSGLTAGWWLAFIFVVLGAVYLTLVARLRHLRVRRQLDLAFRSDAPGFEQLDWAALEHDLRLVPAAGDDVARSRPIEVDNRAIARFLVCWVLGWVLTPIVTVLGFVRRDLTQGVGRRIVKWQQYGRSQSLRLLTVGAAASVTISAVGALAATAGASPTVAAVSLARQPAVTPSLSSYTVVAGDTLSSISARSGESVAALAAANHLADPNFILPGEILTVTGPVAASAAFTARYTVQQGDTLNAIARRHGTTVAALVEGNAIANPNLIMPGQVLSVPAAVAAASAAAPTAVTSATSATSHYTVRAGDTMAAIARRYHTTVAALASASRVANPNRILPGQVLVVPASTVSAAAAAPVNTAATSAKAPIATVATTATKQAAAPASAPRPAPVAAGPAPVPAAALSALPLPAQYLRGGSVDQGVDYSAPGGTPLYAMGPGKIIRTGMSGFGPDCPVLEITAGPLAGKTVYYGHAGANLVPLGATVVAGQQISIVGYGIVGYSSGPHLEIGFYPPWANGGGGAMLQYLNGVVGHSTAG